MKVHVTVSVNTTCGDTASVDSLFELPEGINISEFIDRFEINLNKVFGQKIDELLEEVLDGESHNVLVGFGPVPKGVLNE